MNEVVSNDINFIILSYLDFPYPAKYLVSDPNPVAGYPANLPPGPS